MTRYINPKKLHSNPAFTQMAIISGAHRIIYIGEQNALDGEGNLVGIDNIEKQAQQVLHNLEACLEEANATLEHVVKWTVLVKAGVDYQPAFAIFQQKLMGRKNPPLITMMFVISLAHPNFLLGIEAMAVVDS